MVGAGKIGPTTTKRGGGDIGMKMGRKRNGNGVRCQKRCGTEPPPSHSRTVLAANDNTHREGAAQMPKYLYSRDNKSGQNSQRSKRNRNAMHLCDEEDNEEGETLSWATVSASSSPPPGNVPGHTYDHVIATTFIEWNVSASRIVCRQRQSSGRAASP